MGSTNRTVCTLVHTICRVVEARGLAVCPEMSWATDNKCTQFDSRPQWGEYLTAQDNQEKSQRLPTHPEPQTSDDRAIKAPRRKS